jgi:hypothetical protein
MPKQAHHNTGIAVFREDLMLGIVCVYLEMRKKGCLLPRTEFSEVQDALEDVVIELRVAKDAHDRRALLHRMLTLIVQADTIVREEPLIKSARAGASD